MHLRRSPVPFSIRRLFENFEFLAHTLAYNTHNKELTSNTNYTLRTNTIKLPYSGLNFYILEPADVNDHDIKVIFKGTKCLGSLVRDLEREAPGSETFVESSEFILAELHFAITDLLAKNNTIKNISITVCGHSLGAADAQNFFAAILNKIKDSYDDEIIDLNDSHYHKIKKLRLATFNAPGITHKVAAQAEINATALKEYGIELECFWMLAHRDPVQQTGQINILANVSHEIAKVHLIKVRHHQSNSYTAGLTAHRTHFFNEAAYLEHNHDYYTNANSSDNDYIRYELNYKSTLLQNPVIETSKFFLEYLLRGVYSAYHYQFYYNASYYPVDSHEPWVFVTPSSPFTVNLSTNLLNTLIENHYSFSAPIYRIMPPASSIAQIELMGDEVKSNPIILRKPFKTNLVIMQLLAEDMPVAPAAKVQIKQIEEVKSESDIQIEVVEEKLPMEQIIPARKVEIVLLPEKNITLIIKELEIFLFNYHPSQHNKFYLFNDVLKQKISSQKFPLATDLKNLIIKSNGVLADIVLAFGTCKKMNSLIDSELNESRRDAFYDVLTKIEIFLSFNRRRIASNDSIETPTKMSAKR